MAEPLFTLEHALGDVGIKSRFYGLSWPSRFSCEVLLRCQGPDNKILDDFISNFTHYTQEGMQWSTSAQESAERLLLTQLRSDVFLANAELFVCTIARLCPTLRQVMDEELPMLVYFSTELTWSSDSATQDYELLPRIRDVLLDARHFAAVTSPYWAAQVKYQTGVHLSVVRPLSRYIGSVRYHGSRSKDCLIARSRLFRGTAHGVAFLHLIDLLLPNFHPLTLTLQGDDWISWELTATFRAVLLLPHHQVLMALYDYYALAMPLVIPSKRYMLHLLQLRGHSFDFRAIDDYDVTIAGDMRTLFVTSPMLRSFQDVKVAWCTVELMSFYTLPHVATFDSLQEALQALSADDMEGVSTEMQHEQERHRQLVLRIYRDNVATLLPHRRNREPAPMEKKGTKRK